MKDTGQSPADCMGKKDTTGQPLELLLQDGRDLKSLEVKARLRMLSMG